MPIKFNNYEVTRLEYRKCSLYGLKSKKQLEKLLQVESIKVFTEEYIAKNTRVSLQNGGKRLIENPSFFIKQIQSIILHKVKRIPVGEEVFSGVKGKSYIGNAKVHQGKKYIYKVDISKFFPSITRDMVYRFYKKSLGMSSDVAAILTNLSTINLDLKNQGSNEMIEVNSYLSEHGIGTRNHLFTGAPHSTLFSYLINVDMFDRLKKLAEINNCKMTIYVDDIVFSSNFKISNKFRTQIVNIITNANYKVNSKKCRYIRRGYIVKVTGVILDKNANMQVPNCLMKKTHEQIDLFKKRELVDDMELMGRICSCSQINGKFKELKKVIKDSRN